MPKESVHDRHNDDGRTNQVDVGWHPDGVQIGTIDINRPHGENGWFVDLDRAGTNRLIRILRRARDSAYGRDE